MSRTLLLADENATMHRIVALTFAERDIRVISARDGIEAIELIGRDRPDIVVADANLPRLDGYKLAQYVTSQPFLAGVPVLLLTGAFDTIDESRIKQSGAAGAIVKPFEPSVVINKVKELLGLGHKSATPPTVVPPGSPVSVEPEAPAARTHGEAPLPDTPSPRSGPVGVPRVRRADATTAPAAWDELRRQSVLDADLAPGDAVSGTGDDYFDRLDAAFETLDAQPAGRLLG